ncbi:hypothetical protein [Streptomyces sp. NPDC004658]|uniref:hypothetical protein n=1 Tax=Streptomyces sp. NPDC004658 TaxID=3154672 RepID=UPI0033A38654
MTPPTRRTCAHQPRPRRRRHRAASLGAALATLTLGLTGQLTAHPAAGTGGAHSDAPVVPAYSGTAPARGLPPV